jgi:hypothetical protein
LIVDKTTYILMKRWRNGKIKTKTPLFLRALEAWMELRRMEQVGVDELIEECRMDSDMDLARRVNLSPPGGNGNG